MIPSADHRRAMIERPRQNTAVEAVEGVIPRFPGIGGAPEESGVFPLALFLRFFLGVRLQPARGEHRREGEGNEQREQRGAGHHQAELAEEFADNAAHEGDRHENHHVHQRDAHGGQPDLRAPVDHRLLRRLAHREVPVNIFDHHDGVIDENPHRQRQAHHRHHIDGEAEGNPSP